MNASVLVVDDEPTFRLLAEEALTGEGFEVTTAARLSEARQITEAGMPDVIVLDRRLPDGDGLDFFSSLPPNGAGSTVVIVVTAYGDVESAVSALKAGAADYLTKPIQLTDLVIKLRKVLEARGLRDQLRLARSHASGGTTVGPQSAAMRGVLDRLHQVASSPATPVFLRGASGVGKQRAAESLHAMTYGADADAPFVDLNCAALPDDLVESELFGHEKGAFTDARAARRGLIELAHGGTLFLDEVAELPIRAQAKLLKFLDSMRFRRLGGQREISVSLRVVAATNQNAEAMVQAGRLREDLYHRLAVFVIEIPPLTERRQDISALAKGFATFFAERVKKRPMALSSDALDRLLAYAFPGNVRELRNIVERAVILARGSEIRAGDIVLPSAINGTAVDTTSRFFGIDLGADGAPQPLVDIERAYVARVLHHCEGHRTTAAHTLGISYPTFLKRLRELGLD